jgi:hypothetical protein
MVHTYLLKIYKISSFFNKKLKYIGMDETLGKLIKQSTQQKGEKMEQTKER